jgi:hypothetical protein
MDLWSRLGVARTSDGFGDDCASNSAGGVIRASSARARRRMASSGSMPINVADEQARAKRRNEVVRRLLGHAGYHPSTEMPAARAASPYAAARPANDAWALRPLGLGTTHSSAEG